MSKNIAIYYGTMTGNAEALAQGTYDRLAAEGWEVSLHNLADVKAEDLAERPGHAIFVVSTWGDGEPPSDAEDFFNGLLEASVDLSAVPHAVFGLGDSNYEHFNAFAKNLAARLIELGSPQFAELVSADVVFEDDYAAWEKRILDIVAAA